MFTIIKKECLNTTVTRMEIMAPDIAAKAQPGQFVILRVNTDGERIPLTIADYDRIKGTITIIFQIVGATTAVLNTLDTGDQLTDLVGPLGNPTALADLKRVIVIGGGVGSAIAYPIAKKLHELKRNVTTILGFRTSELVILQSEFTQVSSASYLMTDDGTAGTKGLVTAKLTELLAQDAGYDEVIAIGPLIMMKYVALTTKKYGIRTIVSMNPIMIDGTGMCGGCRLTVGGKVKFACVDGPDFDGHEVDFDEAIKRSAFYRDFERQHYEATCNLLNQEVR